MDTLVQHGIEKVFMVAGGGAMYLNDAVGAHPGLDVICVLHEQAAAIAAEAYAKVAGKLALCLVTAGPGGTNAITGVAGGWLDSTPMIVISGQVKRADLVGTSQVRQRGVQELDLSTIVKSITKCAVMVTEPAHIRHDLERALYLAMTGRPGPVWIEVPLDVQAALVDPDGLTGFNSREVPPAATLQSKALAIAAADVAQMLKDARRPLLLIGAGVRLSGAEQLLLAMVDKLGVPVLTTWPAMGIVGHDHPLHVGRPGSLAARGANFALQASDLLLSIGARLDMVTTGYDPKDFARNARKIVVDVDANELAKLEGAIETPICADAREFLAALAEAVGPTPAEVASSWLERCRTWKDAYPLVRPEHRRPGEHVSTYYLGEVVSDLIADDDVLVPCSSGLAIEIFLLTLRLRTGQRASNTTALGAMGYGPPTAIGACIAAGGRRTICVDGDGGLQLNAQELETIRRLGLPIKLLVLSNDGYASIRASQQRWFGRLVGADASSGVTFPPLKGLAEAYGLPYVRIDGWAPLDAQLRAVFEMSGPVVCEVPSPSAEPREPVQVSEVLPDGAMRSRAIEDLAPLLSRKELASNLVLDHQDE
jgi:acetolactate synthase-1/2/3 large subunit